MSTATTAFDALRARFTAAELAVVAPQAMPEVIRAARERRAAALLRSRLEETDESRRETPVIRAVHAFYVSEEWVR